MLLASLRPGAVAGPFLDDWLSPQLQRLPQTKIPSMLLSAFPPQAYFVDRIGGDAIVVETMVPAGAEPHTYEAQA